MKYSVLMSVYKKENPDFLKAAMESIYENQTKKPDEIVVVFDGELTDELYDVLDKFRQGKEEIVKYYPQKINRGLGEALKTGAEKCTGDYIFRMDTDDISVSERFEKQAAYMEKHPDIDVLGGAIAEFEQTPENEKMRRRICPENHDDVVKMSKKRNPMNHMTVCIKRAALEECGGYKKMPLMEDYYLWARMIVRGKKFGNIQEPLVYARVGNGFDGRRAAREQIASRKKIMEVMLKHGTVTKTEALFNVFCMCAGVYCPAGVRKFAYNKILRK